MANSRTNYFTGSNWLVCRVNWHKIILLLIILQSIGIRAVPYQGIISSLVIVAILITRISIHVKHMVVFIASAIIYIAMSARGLTDLTLLYYLTAILIVAFMYINYIKDKQLHVEYDLALITWWLSLHGLISYLVYMMLPSSFITVQLDHLRYRLLGPFIVSGWEPIRATGLCWEPGLLQYIANLSLFLGIKQSQSKWKLLVSFLTVVCTFSTAGIFVLSVNILYFFISKRCSVQQWISVVFALLLVAAFSVKIFYQNIFDKIGGTNVSGLIRLRDMKVGWELILDKPIWGHGQFDEQYLISKSKIYEIATELFSKEYLASSGDMSGGYTNGFMGFLASYGLIIGAIAYLCFYMNNIIIGEFKERIIFFVISILTFISEPITNTSLFYVFAMSGIYSNWIAHNCAVNRK